MTWRDAWDLWHRLDGAVMTGVATYFYLSRRSALRRLRRASGVIGGQEAMLNSLVALARAHGFMPIDPRDDDDEPRRLH